MTEPAITPHTVDGTIDLPRDVSSKQDELIVLLRFGLPEQNRRLWYNASDLQGLLKDGGLPTPTLPDNSVSLVALRTNRNKNYGIKDNLFQKKKWYCFYNGEPEFDTPTAQFKHLQLLKKKKLEEEINDIQPSIPVDHFGSFKLKYLAAYKQTAAKAPSADASNPQESNEASPAAAPRTNGAAGVTPPASTTPASANDNPQDANHAPPKKLPKDANRAPPIVPQPKPKWTNGNRSDLPLEVPDGQQIGLVFTAIGKNSEAIKMAEDHARQCPGKCRLKLKERYKTDFQIVEIHGCGFCNKEYTIKSGPEAVNAKKRHGGQASEISKIIGHAAHGTALLPKKLGEFLDQTGTVRSSDYGLNAMYDRRKNAVRNVSKQHLRKNRIDHNRAIRSKYGTKCDVKHIDSEGNVHVLCAHALASDGGGETRAHNHRITGHQHCTVIFSCLTGKPLAIKHDQISCVNCSRALTKLIDGGKRAKDITEDDLKHPGLECYRNIPSMDQLWRRSTHWSISRKNS